MPDPASPPQTPITGVSILIAAHNRCELLAQTLDSLASLRLPQLPIECVLVANACTDDTEGVVRRAAAKFPFALRAVAEPRRGVSFARNRAVAEARHDLLIFIDSDCRADPDWLLEHLRMYTERGEDAADLVTGRIELWWEDSPTPDWLSPSMLEALGQHRFSEAPVQLREPRAYAANFSFRRDVARAVAGEGEPFRTDVGRSGATGRLAHEETVFARRAMELGFRFWWTPAAVVHHWVPRSSVSDAFFGRSAYWGSVSYMLTAEPMSRPRALLLGLKSWVRAHVCIARLVLANIRVRPRAASIARMDLNGALGRLHGAWCRLTGRNIPRP
ncbi:MAG: glycosyltransferase [Phycisphaerales bacterium]